MTRGVAQRYRDWAGQIEGDTPMWQKIAKNGYRPGPTRRGLLAGAGALAMPSVARGNDPGPCDWCVPGEVAWRKLAGQARVQVIRPGEPGFAERALPQNLRYRRVEPLAIARCGAAESVGGVIAWCRDHDLPFAIRGGGHSYAGHSSTPGVMIDTSAMAAVTVDAASGDVTIEAGARNGDVARALQAAGRVMTHGRCPSVGIAGFLLGGGIGFNMRRFGVGSDQMAAAELVTADGQIRQLSATQEPELFWALQGGGGGNFGVSTRFRLFTQPVDPLVTVFALRWDRQAEQVARAFIAAAQAAPDAFGSRFSLQAPTPERRRAGAEVEFDLLGQFAGPRSGLMDILAPVVAAVPPARMRIEERPYWDGQAFLSEAGEPGFYQERSGFVRGGLSEAVVECGLRWLRNWPGTEVSADVRFFQTGGAVNRLTPDATAFVHRDSAWLFSIGLDWSVRDQIAPTVMGPAHHWQDGFYAEMRSLCGTAAYQNFPDPSLADWRQAYYGANLARLEKVKAAADPGAVFRHGQSL